MDEVRSLHNDFADAGDENTSGHDQFQPLRQWSSDKDICFYCPDCGMPAQSRTAASVERRAKERDQLVQEESSSRDLHLHFDRQSSSSIITHTDVSDQSYPLSFDCLTYHPDAELILLIQELESERFDLIVSEKRHEEADNIGLKNGWHTSTPLTNDPCVEAVEEGERSSSNRKASRISESSSTSPDIVKTKSSSSSSARRKNRIRQIDLELVKLRQLQEMEERTLRQSTRSNKGSRSISTATTPGSLGGTRDLPMSGSDIRSMSGHPSDTRSFSNSMSQPDMLLATMSTLFEVDKEKITDVLARQCMSRDQCFLLYQQNVIPIVIRLIHDPMCGISSSPPGVRISAGRILFQLVSCQSDDKRGRREGRVLHWLEEVRAYSTAIIHPDTQHGRRLDDHDDEADSSAPYTALQNLRKNSADEEYRHAICFLGGLNAVAEFLQCDFVKFDNTNNSRHVDMRQFACMILTNLSFGDGCNKALLCSSQSFLETLVHLLSSPSEDLRLSVASVIRNISWRADVTSKRSLRNSKVVSSLLRASMQGKTEASLKILLSALSNLSGHNDENRQEICAYEGALPFLIRNLQYKSPSQSQTHEVQEFCGCILRSISSVIAVRPEYRKVLRENNCLEVLVEHLRSPCIALVANSCGTLWNLSARCVEDQQRLWELQAVPLLENLSRSTHESIASHSAKAVKNLRKAREGLHGVGWKGADKAISRKPRSVRSGRPDDNIQSADDMADDYDFEDSSAGGTHTRAVTSVPSSPLISSRSARSNGSYRFASNMQTTGARFGMNEADRRDRSVQLMASISRQVGGDVPSTSRSHADQQRLSSKRLSSPPLSPLKQQNVMSSFSHFSQPSHFTRDEEGGSWNAGRFPYSTQPLVFQDFPPWEVPNDAGTAKKIPEEESNDECIDFGSRFNTETILASSENHHPELNIGEDTIKHFTTEGSQFSTTNPSPEQRLFSSHPDTRPSLGPSLRHNMVPFSPKQVSIGETSTLMMTPMACSRSSTPNALSDVETMTGEEMEKQSVYSEFSRDQSGIITPTFSEIPASPSLMRTSPRVQKRRILPAPPIQREEVKAAPPPPPSVPELEDIDGALALDDMVKNMRNQSLKRKAKKEKPPAASVSVVVALLPPVSRLPLVGELTAQAPPPVEPPLLFEVPSMEMQDSVRTFASEGLSGATSLNSLSISMISGMSALGVPKDAQATLTKTLPPLPPKPAGRFPVKKPDQPLVFHSTPTVREEASMVCLVTTSGEAPVKEQEEEAVAVDVLIEKVEESQATDSADLPDSFAFRWPVPPMGAPPLPRRVSSLPPSPSQVVDVTGLTLSPSLPECLMNVPEDKEPSACLPEPDKVVVSEVNEAVCQPEAPPVPPPFYPSPVKSTSSPTATKTSVTETTISPAVPDPEAEVLADMIYGILPRKHKPQSKRTTSDRKVGLQHNLSGNTAAKSVSHSHSATLDRPEGKGVAPRPARSHSSHLLGGKASRGKAASKSQPASRDGLTLSITQKAEPDVGGKSEEPRMPSGGTSMWIDLNGGGSAVNALQKGSAPFSVPTKQSEVRQCDSGSNSDDDNTHASSKPQKRLGNGSLRAPSPDVFDTISQMDTNLGSRFTSEASEGEDGPDDPPRRPKIVKPGSNGKASNGAADPAKSPKPVKGGSKKPRSAVVNGQSSNSVRGTIVASSESASPRPENGRQPSDETEPVPSLNRLVKQGTFVKERGPTVMAPPWIFPDSDVSKQSPSLRQRYASVTRGPRESFSSMSSGDNPNIKPGGPRSRSARSMSRPTIPLAGVPGNGDVPKEKPLGNASPKSQRKKSLPVASRIASLWRGGDKKPADKASKNGSKADAAAPVESFWKKDRDTALPSQSADKVVLPVVKSPTMSERLLPSRSFLAGIAPRMTATLPKKMHHSTAGQNGQDTSNAAVKKGSITVTSV